MKAKDLIDRNYKAELELGKVFPRTSGFDYVTRLQTKVKRIEIALQEIKRTNTIGERFFNEKKTELTELIMVAFSMAKHFNIDTFKEIEKKVLINEQKIQGERNRSKA